MPKLPVGSRPLEPTLDDEVRRLVIRHGAEAVKSAVKRQTAVKKGRKRIPDWPELRPYIEEDATIWLDGGDPFSRRTNYAIAKALADAKPGYNHAATMQRLERKLGSRPYSRKWYILVAALDLSEGAYSYKRHLDVIRALHELDDTSRWDTLLEINERKVAQYVHRFGEPPERISMREIAAKTLNELFPKRPESRGILGRAK